MTLNFRLILHWIRVNLDLGESYCYSIYVCILPPFVKDFLYIDKSIPWAIQKEIYCNADIRMDRSKKINYIKDEEFQNSLSENYENIYNNMVEVMV